MNKNLDYLGHAQDFTEKNYQSILKKLKKTHNFIFFNELSTHKKSVLLRHDCDFSLNRALSIAKIESSLGISSTFFINPHSDFYNIFEKSQTEIIFQIINLGHQLGLHFDCEYYGISSAKDLENEISYERSVLNKFFKADILAFSFHNPTKFELSLEDDSYGGLISTYSKLIKDNFEYCSDSNGYWRHSRLIDFLNQNLESNLQILTHPGWWLKNPIQPEKRIYRALFGRAKSNFQNYKQLLNKMNRKNIS